MSDGIRLALAAIAVWLATFVGPGAPPQAHPALVGWLLTDAGLDHEAVGCVAAHLRAGLLADVPDAQLTSVQLRSQGLAAIPGHRRQIAGDVIIACSVDPEGPAQR